MYYFKSTFGLMDHKCAIIFTYSPIQLQNCKFYPLTLCTHTRKTFNTKRSASGLQTNTLLLCGGLT